MRRKPFVVSILAMVFAVLFVGGATSAMAQSTIKTTTKDQPVDTIMTTCDVPFEPIHFTGFQRTMYEVKNDHDGSPLRFKFTATWENVVGTTPSGAIYKGKSKYMEQADLDGLPSYHKITVNERFKSKTKGSPDMVYFLKFKIRIDEDGNVTQDKEDERTECKP